MKTRGMRRVKGLTKEQEELRQRGLRLLARMIARRHLASLAHDDGVRPSVQDADDLGGSVPLRTSGDEPPVVEEDEHAG